MHIGEERFRTIRMSELEFANLRAAFTILIDDNDVAVEAYPVVDAFLAALGYSAGYHDSGEVVFDTELPQFDPEEDE